MSMTILTRITTFPVQNRNTLFSFIKLLIFHQVVSANNNSIRPNPRALSIADTVALTKTSPSATSIAAVAAAFGERLFAHREGAGELFGHVVCS